MRMNIFFNDEWNTLCDDKIDYFFRKDNMLFQRTSLDEAHFILIPFFCTEFKEVAKVKLIQDSLKTANKKLLIFYKGDDTKAYPVNNSIVFRQSFFKNHRRDHEYPMPSFVNDLVQEMFTGKIIVKKRENRFLPIVGFCGSSYAEYAGQQIRNEALAQLILSPFVRTNFTLRTTYNGNLNADERKATYNEMISNMQHSEYCLAIRGSGNYSHRLYEICSLGKIPLYIDTEGVLPYEEYIDYRKEFIWINGYDLSRSGEILNCYNRDLSNEEYAKKHLSIYQLWKNWLSMDGYMKNLWRYLEKYIE